MNPKVMMGKPIIKGTRIPVELVLRKLSEEALLDAYPHLTCEDIRAALAHAAEVIGGRGGGGPLIRFLADESCDFAVVRALRAHG